MRARCLKILQSECFSDESLVDYANLYYEHLNVLKLKNFYNNPNISHISEEDENSQLEISLGGKSQTELNNKNLIEATSHINSKSNASSLISNTLRSHKSSEKPNSRDCDIRFINREKLNKNNIDYENEQNLLNSEKETEFFFNNNNNNSNLNTIYKNLNNKDSGLSKININLNNYENGTNSKENKSVSNKSITRKNNSNMLKKQKTFVKDLIDIQTAKTFSSKNIINTLRNNNFSNESKSKDVPTGNTSGTFADIMAIPKITVKKKIDEKKELKAEIQRLRSVNEEFNNRRKFKEFSKQRKITLTQYNKEDATEDIKIRNFNISGYSENYNDDNKSDFISESDPSNYGNRSVLAMSGKADGFDKSVEIINSDGNRDGKNLKILELLKSKSKLIFYFFFMFNIVKIGSGLFLRLIKYLNYFNSIFFPRLNHNFPYILLLN